MVEGLREVLLAWTDADRDSAEPFVRRLLTDTNEMLRRVGIFLLAERWPHLKSLYPSIVGPRFFERAHLHELYWLLRRRFEGFSDDDKSAKVTCRLAVAFTTIALPQSAPCRERYVGKVESPRGGNRGAGSSSPVGREDLGLLQDGLRRLLLLVGRVAVLA